MLKSKKIDDMLKFFKENLALILVLPTVLGGFWQIVELSKMSISYIRFFSATQLLPDGLMMLFIILMIFFAVKIGNLNKKGNLRRNNIKISEKKPAEISGYCIRTSKSCKLTFIENPIYRKSAIVPHVILLILSIFGIYLMFYIVPNLESFKSDEITFAEFVISLAVFVTLGRMMFESIVVLMVLFFESSIVISIRNNFLTKSDTIQELLLFPFVAGLTIVSFFLFIVMPLAVFSLFHGEYLLPQNLKNIDYIQNSLDNKESNNSKISYFNDKFIFIEHVNNDKSTTIEILKFDELFKK